MKQLWPQFHEEKERLGNLMLKDPIVQLARMLDEKQTQDPSTSKQGQ